MKKISLKNIMAASVCAAVFAFSASADVGAWNSDPFAPVTTSATAASTALPDGAITNPTSVQTTENTAADDIEDESYEEEIEEDIEEETDEIVVEIETDAPQQTTSAAPASSAASEEVTTRPPQQSAPSYTPADSYTMYATQAINVRSGPGTSYDILGVAYANSAVTVIGSSGDWLAVSHNGGTGFILGSLLTATEPQTTTATSAPQTQPTEEETEPSQTSEQTTAPETQDDEPITNPTTSAPQTTEAEQTETAQAASESGNSDIGFPSVLIALACAAAAFIIVAVIPIAVLELRHRSIYRY